MALYQSLSAGDKAIFEKAYSASYSPAKEILQECYDEVKSGNEIRSVIMQGDRVNSGKGFIGKIDGTDAWVTGEQVRASRDEDKIPLNPFTAGVYVSMMMAQIDILKVSECFASVFAMGRGNLAFLRAISFSKVLMTLFFSPPPSPHLAPLPFFGGAGRGTQLQRNYQRECH